jgi:hypothetical protein
MADNVSPEKATSRLQVASNDIQRQYGLLLEVYASVRQKVYDEELLSQCGSALNSIHCALMTIKSNWAYAPYNERRKIAARLNKLSRQKLPPFLKNLIQVKRRLSELRKIRSIKRTKQKAS